jgi:CRP-like cAMP-binding protein
MASNAVLSGDLRFISLADCFQILGGNNSTGTLTIESPYVSTAGSISFLDGNPVNAKSGNLHGLDAIYPLFGWVEGTFEFREEIPEPEQVVTSSRMEIVLDALRMLDDGLIEKVGPVSVDSIYPAASDGLDRGSQGAQAVIRGPLADYMYVIDEEGFHDGVKIVTEGGHGTWIWVILEGTVAMTRNTAKGTLHITKLGEGSFIGTMTSFVQRDYVRNATVSALGDIQLGVLDTQRLNKEYVGLSPGFKALILSLDNRLRKITDKAVELHENSLATNETPEDTEMIMDQGATGGGIFSITKGKAYVVRSGQQGDLPLFTLEEGDVFGDVPFLDTGHEPRCAKVLGSEDLEFEKMDPVILRQEYNQLSQTLKNLVDNTCTCVSVTTRMAFHLQDRKGA